MANPADRPTVTVFGPDPLLSITIERTGAVDEVHVHPAGQGVWVARMAGELGAWPIMCGCLGGETGAVLLPLLEALTGERRLVPTAGVTGSYVTDRRAGQRQVLATAARPALSRHEVDDLVAATCAAAFESAVLVLCNPFPAEGLPDYVYETLVADVRAAGIPVLVDLSSPRLERTLPHGPDLVKLNDWELAQYVCGPVDGHRMLDAARRLQAAGAGAVTVTRAERPILVLPRAGEPFEVVPRPLPYGFREGCGDAMMGAIAAGWAQGLSLPDTVRLGAAAGSANFLRHGLGTGKREVVEEMVRQVMMRPYPAGEQTGRGLNGQIGSSPRTIA
ncbi:MAG TPA: PfkB family carbohydrate kinase [Solirubrobacteraceae bacterium]|nr:PfkB family carbohydrate kinase [Solirubrobacteraceae bacterium]